MRVHTESEVYTPCIAGIVYILQVQVKVAKLISAVKFLLRLCLECSKSVYIVEWGACCSGQSAKGACNVYSRCRYCVLILFIVDEYTVYTC